MKITTKQKPNNINQQVDPKLGQALKSYLTEADYYFSKEIREIIKKLIEADEALERAEQALAKQGIKAKNFQKKEPKFSANDLFVNLNPKSSEDIKNVIQNTSAINSQGTVVIPDIEAERVADEVEEVAKEVEAEQVVPLVTAKSKISAKRVYDLLNACLHDAKRNARRGSSAKDSNLLLAGPSGSGKSSLVQQWAHRNNVNLITLDPQKTNVEELLNNPEFLKQLEEPSTVLLLDDFDQFSASERRILTRLSKDPKYPNINMIVATINPYGNELKTEPLTQKEASNFTKNLTWETDVKSTLAYLTDKYTKDLLELKSQTKTNENNEVVLESEDDQEDYWRLINNLNALDILANNLSDNNLLAFSKEDEFKHSAKSFTPKKLENIFEKVYPDFNGENWNTKSSYKDSLIDSIETAGLPEAIENTLVDAISNNNLEIPNIFVNDDPRLPAEWNDDTIEVDDEVKDPQVLGDEQEAAEGESEEDKELNKNSAAQKDAPKSIEIDNELPVDNPKENNDTTGKEISQGELNPEETENIGKDSEGEPEEEVNPDAQKPESLDDNENENKEEQAPKTTTQDDDPKGKLSVEQKRQKSKEVIPLLQKFLEETKKELININTLANNFKEEHKDTFKGIGSGFIASSIRDYLENLCEKGECERADNAQKKYRILKNINSDVEPLTGKTPKTSTTLATTDKTIEEPITNQDNLEITNIESDTPNNSDDTTEIEKKSKEKPKEVTSKKPTAPLSSDKDDDSVFDFTDSFVNMTNQVFNKLIANKVANRVTSVEEILEKLRDKVRNPKVEDKDNEKIKKINSWENLARKITNTKKGEPLKLNPEHYAKFLSDSSKHVPNALEATQSSIYPLSSTVMAIILSALANAGKEGLSIEEIRDLDYLKKILGSNRIAKPNADAIVHSLSLLPKNLVIESKPEKEGELGKKYKTNLVGLNKNHKYVIDKNAYELLKEKGKIKKLTQENLRKFIAQKFLSLNLVDEDSFIKDNQEVLNSVDKLKNTKINSSDKVMIVPKENFIDYLDQMLPENNLDKALLKDSESSKQLLYKTLLDDLHLIKELKKKDASGNEVVDDIVIALPNLTPALRSGLVNIVNNKEIRAKNKAENPEEYQQFSTDLKDFKDKALSKVNTEEESNTNFLDLANQFFNNDSIDYDGDPIQELGKHINNIAPKNGEEDLKQLKELISQGGKLYIDEEDMPFPEGAEEPKETDPVTIEKEKESVKTSTKKENSRDKKIGGTQNKKLTKKPTDNKEATNDVGLSPELWNAVYNSKNKKNNSEEEGNNDEFLDILDDIN